MNRFPRGCFFVPSCVIRKQSGSAILVLVMRTGGIGKKTCNRLFGSNLHILSAVVIHEACGEFLTPCVPRLSNGTRGCVANAVAPQIRSITFAEAKTLSTTSSYSV